MAYPLAALIVAVVGTACAAGGDASLALPDAEMVSPSASPTPSPIIIDIPAPTPETEVTDEAGGDRTPAPLEMLPLDALAPDAIPYLEGRNGRIGVAIVVPEKGVATHTTAMPSSRWRASPRCRSC